MGAGVVILLIAASLLVAGGVALGTYFLVKSLIPTTVAEADNALPQQQIPPKVVFPPQQLPKLNPPIGTLPINPNVPKAAPGPQVGQAAPEIVGEDLDGQAFKLSDYRGKVVVLDFWGNW